MLNLQCMKPPTFDSFEVIQNAKNESKDAMSSYIMFFDFYIDLINVIVTAHVHEAAYT